MEDVFILSATRTAIGGFGGSLKDKSPIDLGIAVTGEAISRSGLSAGDIDHGVYGNVIHTEARDMYISRCITIGAGMAETAPALTVNRLCDMVCRPSSAPHSWSNWVMQKRLLPAGQK